MAATRTLAGRRWFDEHGVSFARHYTGSLACVPSRPTIFTGQYPDLHGVTQTDGIGKRYDDSRLRWLRQGEVPTLGNWFRAAGYDTHYDGKWHISHADLDDPATGGPLATNDDDGVVDPAAVRRYLDADPLGAVRVLGLGGSRAARRGDVQQRFPSRPADRRPRRRLARRPLRAAPRRRRRRALAPVPAGGQLRQPARHRAVPGVVRDAARCSRRRLDPPHVPAAPTADEDLSHQARRADRVPRGVLLRLRSRARRSAAPTSAMPSSYRDLYYRLHAEVDAPIDRVRRAVTEGGSDNAVLVRTSDHGDLLGAHGGLHQKWFNLYDEATRVPFVVARIGAGATSRRAVSAPTSHVDLVPTLLGAAGIDVAAVAATLRDSFSEVHDLPGRDLMPVVDGAPADETEPCIS